MTESRHSSEHSSAPRRAVMSVALVRCFDTWSKKTWERQIRTVSTALDALAVGISLPPREGYLKDTKNIILPAF